MKKPDLTKLPLDALEDILSRIDEGRAEKHAVLVKRWEDYLKEVADRGGFFRKQTEEQSRRTLENEHVRIDEFFDEIKEDVEAEIARREKGNEDVEYLRLDGQELRDAEHALVKEEMLTRSEITANIEPKDMEARETSAKLLEGFEEQKTIEDAERFAKNHFGIIADYSEIPLDVANNVNQELTRAFNMFGTVGIIENINADYDLEARGAFGNYKWKTNTISVRPERGSITAERYIKNAPKGVFSDKKFSTNSPLHGYRHEIGHALHKYCEENRHPLDLKKLNEGLNKIRHRAFHLSRQGYEQLSEYAGESIREMVAEAFAQARTVKQVIWQRKSF